jgi:hypothetical protein
VTGFTVTCFTVTGLIEFVVVTVGLHLYFMAEGWGKERGL